MDLLSEVFGETIILTIDSLILGFCVKQLFNCSHVLNALQAAPVLSVDSSLEKSLAKYPERAVPYAVVRGEARAQGRPLTSSHDASATGVLQRVTLREHVVARSAAGFWSEQARTLHTALNAAPFVLRGDSGRQVHVEDPLAADILEMDVISDKFEPMSPSVMDHLWGFFSGVRQRGLQTVEEMLRDGSYITVVGELTEDGAGILKIQPPRSGLPMMLTTSTKVTLVRKLSESRNSLRIVVCLLSCVALGVGTRVLIKWLRRRRRRAVAAGASARLAAERRQRRALARPAHTDDEMQSQLCTVCAENPKEIILLPCGHVCLCEDCSDRIHDKCPVCRDVIQSKAAAFIV